MKKKQGVVFSEAADVARLFDCAVQETRIERDGVHITIPCHTCKHDLQAVLTPAEVAALWTGAAKPADVQLSFDNIFVPLRCGHAGAMGSVAWTDVEAAYRYYTRPSRTKKPRVLRRGQLLRRAGQQKEKSK